MGYGVEMSTMMALADISDIFRLSLVKSDQDRENLDTAVFSLLDSSLDHDEKYEAADALKTLLSKASLDIREMLAERLCVQENIPTQLLLALAYDDEITVAQPILIETKSFDENDWDHVIAKTTTKHWQTIAGRRDLTDKTVSTLLDKKDDATTVVLLGNRTIVLKADMMAKIKAAAFHLGNAHTRLLERNDIDMRLISELYWSTSLDLRNQIINRYNINPSSLDDALENIVQELINANANNHDVTEDILDLATRYKERREINAQYLIKTLRRGQIAFFMALISQLTNLDLRVVRHIILKEGGELLAIVCKSQNFMKSDFASFFLMTRAARPGEHRVNQGELSHALTTFDKIKREDAKKLIDSWIKKPETVTEAV